METIPLALKNPDPDMIIRPVQLTDIVLLHKACWSERPQAMVYQLIARAQQIARQGRGLGVVITGQSRDDVRGYGQLTMWSSTAEISDLVIREDDRGKGMGTALIQYLVRASKEMQAGVVEIGVARSNPRAMALYRRLGFVDNHEIMLNLGQGQEPVLYLKLIL